MRDDFLSYVENEGDEHMLKTTRMLCHKVFDVMSEGYTKHVTSTLLCTVNKITAVSCRGDWLLYRSF